MTLAALVALVVGLAVFVPWALFAWAVSTLYDDTDEDHDERTAP